MKKLSALAALFCTLTLTSCSADAAKTATPAPTTEDQKTLYSLGVLMSQSLATFELKPEELAMVQKGLTDGVTGAKTEVKAEEYLPKVQALQQARLKVAQERSEKAGTDFLAKAATETGATKTASGMVIKHTQPGNGASPAATDQVKVHYTGKLITGKVFDSSVE